MKHQKFEIAVAGYDYRFKTYARDGVEASVKVKCCLLYTSIIRAISKQKETAADAVSPFRSAHREQRYPGEGLPQLPAVEVFRKRDQLVGIVDHLSLSLIHI